MSGADRRRELHERNRASWNAAIPAHNSHKGDIARFLREGGSTLFPEDEEFLGDLREQSVVHLLCGPGHDSLSMAHRGARVVGVDICDAAITTARALSDATGIRAEFHRADVYDWLDAARTSGRRFDVAYASYGVLHWLSDLAGWVESVAGVLTPGGRLVVVEFHPLALMLDHDGSFRFPYFPSGEALVMRRGVGDYVAMAGPTLVPWHYEAGVQGFRNPHPCFKFPWTVGNLVTAAARAGLAVERLTEYPFMNGARLAHSMREIEGRRCVLAEGATEFPLMLALRATVPGGPLL